MLFVNFFTDVVDGPKPINWSPYGCHYYPDPEAFPSPNLDSLPIEPLKRGEQYYSDLAGNIKKGPVGTGYTCYCAPLFKHLEARLEKDKKELQKAQIKLGQRVAGLEQKLYRGVHGRRSERVLVHREDPDVVLPRSRSLEMIDKQEKSQLQATRSMDELEPQEQDGPRKSVKELVAIIQQKQTEDKIKGENSESSDEEDSLRMRIGRSEGLMGDSNLLNPSCSVSNYENISAEMPRSRIGVYSPTVMLNSKSRYVSPGTKILEAGVKQNELYSRDDSYLKQKDDSVLRNEAIGLRNNAIGWRNEASGWRNGPILTQPKENFGIR